MEVTLGENLSKSEYGFEFISDRLNRTLPWTMFASGYKPSTIDLLFGHGTGAYLNIIKLTERKLASGPHSVLLQVETMTISSKNMVPMVSDKYAVISSLLQEQASNISIGAFK